MTKQELLHALAPHEADAEIAVRMAPGDYATLHGVVDLHRHGCVVPLLVVTRYERYAELVEKLREWFRSDGDVNDMYDVRDTIERFIAEVEASSPSVSAPVEGGAGQR